MNKIKWGLRTVKKVRGVLNSALTKEWTVDLLTGKYYGCHIKVTKSISNLILDICRKML